jgi:hypothetical protein
MKTTIQTAQEAISNAREIIESFDQTAAMTIGFDQKSYSLTANQMATIAGALYLADCEIHTIQHNNSIIA